MSFRSLTNLSLHRLRRIEFKVILLFFFSVGFRVSSRICHLFTLGSTRFRLVCLSLSLPSLLTNRISISSEFIPETFALSLSVFLVGSDSLEEFQDTSRREEKKVNEASRCS